MHVKDPAVHVRAGWIILYRSTKIIQHTLKSDKSLQNADVGHYCGEEQTQQFTAFKKTNILSCYILMLLCRVCALSGRALHHSDYQAEEGGADWATHNLQDRRHHHVVHSE